jgi:hypothetical protein
MSEDQREVVQLKNERGEARSYETVASRLARFREKYPTHALLTEILKDDNDSIAIKAQIGFYTESNFFCVLAEGHAQEFHDSSSINRTACMENAETSAWGRALAAFGFGSPTSVASADEVEKAQRRERELKEHEPGVLVLLQNAAKNGMKELTEAYSDLKNIDRAAVRDYMPGLKREAMKVDKNGKAQTEAGRASETRVHNAAPNNDDLD